MFGFKDKPSNSDIVAGGKAIRVLMMLRGLPKEDAGLKKKAKLALAMAGFDIEAAGRGFVARYEGGVASIVIDDREPADVPSKGRLAGKARPTGRSICKARKMPGYKVIALKGYYYFGVPNGVNAVIKLDVLKEAPKVRKKAVKATVEVAA